MVKETRIIFNTRNIRALRILCHYCDGETLYAIRGQARPTHCAACGTVWTTQDAFYTMALALMDAITYLQETDQVEHFTIRYELDAAEVAG